ncbi:MAG TPA: A24 family peptidase [Stellaceae bacterium]|jgi:leader peptidase (prepilin peptidase)/N-methyltransferase|nr:A24 family peptidase [Stellaceae bacterium]
MEVPEWLWPVLASPFIGSFLGVLVTRLPADRPVAVGRSACDQCGHALGPLDLVPLVSWLALRGRCRHCGANITALPLIIEIGALLVAVWAASVSIGLALWAGCVLGWVLLTLGAIDIRDGILPDVLTLPLVVLGLVATSFLTPWQMLDSAVGAVVGFTIFALIRWLYRRLRGREGMGLGDAKLLAATGAWVTWDGLPSVVLIAAVTGLVLALIMARRGAPLTLNQRIPFGPALCLGTWLVWLYGPITGP